MRVLQNAAGSTGPANYLIKLTVSAVLLYLIARHVNVRATAVAAAAIPVSALLAALAMQLASNCVATARWYVIMNMISVNESFFFYLRSFFKGAFFNQGLPTSIGGDSLRIIDAARIASKKEDAVFGVFIDRIIGLAGLLLLNIFALLINRSLLPGQVYLPLLGILSLLFLGLVALFFLRKIKAFNADNVLGYLGRLSTRYHQVYSSGRAIALQTGLSVLTHLLAMTAFYILGNGVGLHYPLQVYLALVPPVVLLTILPVSLAGWGIREGAMVGFFLLIGADKAAVLSFSIIYGLLNLVASLPGLFVYLGQKNRI
jgi:uncharacterized membrane protein YbhN (UPF0104 family)